MPQAGICWRPLTLTSASLSFAFAEPTAFELRATLAPGAPASHAIAAVDLLAHASAHDDGSLGGGGAHAHALVRSAFFASVSRELRPRCASCKATAALAPLMQAASLHLGRLLDLVGEVQFLEARVPVAASVEEGQGVALSLGYAFFSARAKFVLHLLVASLDPNTPLAWQLDVEDTAAAPPPAAAHAATSAADATALAAHHEEAIRRQVGAVVDAHSRGFGRLRAIHAALLKSFCAVA